MGLHRPWKHGASKPDKPAGVEQDEWDGYAVTQPGYAQNIQAFHEQEYKSRKGTKTKHFLYLDDEPGDSSLLPYGARPAQGQHSLPQEPVPDFDPEEELEGCNDTILRGEKLMKLPTPANGPALTNRYLVTKHEFGKLIKRYRNVKRANNLLHYELTGRMERSGKLLDLVNETEGNNANLRGSVLNLVETIGKMRQVVKSNGLKVPGLDLSQPFDVMAETAKIVALAHEAGKHHQKPDADVVMNGSRRVVGLQLGALEPLPNGTNSLIRGSFKPPAKGTNSLVRGSLKRSARN